MKRFALFLLILLSSAGLRAQGAMMDTASWHSTIYGTAKDFVGHIITVSVYDDYITHTEKKLAETIVGDSGKFSLTFELTEIRQVIIRSKNVYSYAFAEPRHKTEIIFYDRDYKSQVNPEVEYKVQAGIYLDDTTEMNFLVDDFNARFNDWWKENYIHIVAKDSISVIDSFHIAMQRHYAYVRNPYFHPWMDYAMASLEDGTFHSQKVTARKYLYHKPVYYYNSEYMEFFNNYFKDFLFKWSLRKEGEPLRFVINSMVSYDSLMGVMKRFPNMYSDTLRELVMLKGLFELYTNPSYNPQNIIAIVQQAAYRSTIPQHRIVARNIIAACTKLKKGSLAPHFIANTKAGVEVDILEQYKGKYVYLFFFNTTNAYSLSELKYMGELHKRYGKKIMFVSVCLDQDTNAWKSFVKANPKYNWTLLHYDNREKTKDDYNLYSVPAGFVIDPDGKFYASPVDNPSGDLEFLLYRIANPRAGPFIPVNNR
jgi:peroxiredoxin